MERMEVPIIGIGAGSSTDGQVLVLHDLLAIHQGFKPKFVETFANVGEEMVRGVRAYTEAVRSRAFPRPEHAYSIAPEELERLKAAVSERPAHA
jgi:3-methyl-2-oxobutanoate hydroxymethyltransferase